MVLNVVLPETIFDEVTETLVYNAETFAQELPNLALANLFPRVHANTADNATGLRSRYLMYLPTRFTSLLLDNKGCSPKEAWNLLVMRFQDENGMDDVIPILNWLCLLLHATGQNDTGPPCTHVNVISPFVDPDLIAHRQPFC
jgi:hypothetical protein